MVWTANKMSPQSHALWKMRERERVWNVCPKFYGYLISRAGAAQGLHVRVLAWGMHGQNAGQRHSILLGKRIEDMKHDTASFGCHAEAIGIFSLRPYFFSHAWIQVPKSDGLHCHVGLLGLLSLHLCGPTHILS